MVNSKLDLALGIAARYVGTWYSWGGDDPEGFDCSGFVLEVLKSAGLVERGADLTADGLLQKFAPQKVTRFTPGALVFWGENGKATHVEMVLAVCDGQAFTIGASGGGKRTVTKTDAIRDNAFVKVRPVRAGWFAIVQPFGA